MGDTAIEWTDKTWNPVRGCVKISPGCKNCYAETFAERWRGIEGHPYEQGFDLRLVPEKLDEPLKWKKPQMVFVNSMSDLFQQGVPPEYVEKCFDTMLNTEHVYQVLTKRPQNMLNFVKAYLSPALTERVLERIWLGVSVEDRKHGLPRIDILRKVPAVVRFLSIEPLLEDLGQIDLTGIHWVIVGGESGRGARPMHPDWVRSIQQQCVSAKVPFFFKQWGEWTHAVIEAHKYKRELVADGSGGHFAMWKVGKTKAGRLLDGREWNEYPGTQGIE